MDRFKFRMWTQYPDEEPCWASDYEMERCMMEKSYTIIDGIYSCTPEAGYQILEQCTGLKDKNGTLIFEGDVVRWASALDYGVGTIKFIEFDNPCSFDGYNLVIHHHKKGKYGDVYIPLMSVSTHTILGNIHENPELLIEST